MDSGVGNVFLRKFCAHTLLGLIEMNVTLTWALTLTSVMASEPYNVVREIMTPQGLTTNCSL